MKRTIHLKESQLKNLIHESVLSALNEGYGNEVYDEFENIRELIGDDTLISEIVNYMGTDELRDFVDHIKRHYDLDDEEEYEDEEDW